MEPFNIFIDFSLTPRALRSLYNNTNFDSIFKRFIAKDVIKYLSPQVDRIHENDFKLIEFLEKFICDLIPEASSEDVESTLKHIQALNQPSKLCRKTLKSGDVIFSCNDCGLDGTCVVCIDCFHKSAHKDHNYRMSNSDGGGCCDCGDVEAWKKNYACSDHLNLNQANLTLSDFEDKKLRAKQISEDRDRNLEKITRISQGIASKYFLVCQASLHYIGLMISWHDYETLPADLELGVQEDEKLASLLSADKLSKNYFTVLFNDEVHTYDHVINTLVKIIKCTKMTASIMASTISREGRSLIINDNYDSCKQIKEMISNVRDTGQGQLKVEIIHGSILAHQAFAIKLLEWIRKMSSFCDAFRIITAYTLLGTYTPTKADSSTIFLSDMTLVENIMLSNTSYWKIVRIEWNDLFVTVLLSEYSIKEQFARLLMRNYPKLIQNFIQDDHDHSVSILTMTTQLFTVPSLICMLIEEEHALSIISQTLIDTCKSTKRENPAISFENRNTFDMHGLKRGFYIISDLKFLINIQPTKWTEQLKNNVLEAIKILLNLLNSMQGMDSVRRQLGHHLEYEPDWESGMTLQSRLVNFITRLVTYCSFNLDVLIATLKETQVRLLKSGYKMITKELFGYRVSCVHYDVSASSVSVHLPLTRFAAALILELMKRRPSERIPYDESLVILPSKNEEKHKQTMVEIMEPSLRTEVMIAQFRSGMWRRNGYSLVNQIVYFHGPLLRKEMFDRDILVLQEAAAICEANEFMIHLLNKFQLFTWISSDTTREPMVGPKAVSFHNDEEIMAQTMSLGEEFLQLLLTIIGERYCVGIGIIEEEDVIKNEIIQLLCISPSTRSDLTQKLYVNDNEMDCIKAVANLRRSNEASTGKYELKEEYYDRFNPFFYHYNRRQQSNALDAQLKRKKTLHESLICCPPPMPVKLTSQFSNLNSLLKCEILLILIQKVLTRTLGPPEGSQECSTKASIRFLASDLQLDQCLHLIGLGLHEQERSPLEFKYIQAAHDKDIFVLLKSCYDKAKRSKDLIFWLMKKTVLLTDNLSESFSVLLDADTVNTITFIKECFHSSLSACDNMKQANKKRNSEMAAKLQSRIMAMMKVNQDKFLSNPTTKQLVAETEKDESLPQVDASTSTTTKSNFSTISSSHLCILCRDEQNLGFDQPTMVLLAYIQRSAILSKNRMGRKIPNHALTPSNQLKYQLPAQNCTQLSTSPEKYSFTSDNSWTFDATFMPSDLFFGPHISTCGHAMHHSCWEGFFQSIMKRETSRPNRNTRHLSFELEKLEILCPLCECISNATIPLIPSFTNFHERLSGLEQSNSIFSPRSELTRKSADSLSAFLHALRGTVAMFKHIRHIKEVCTGIPINNEDKYMRLLQPKSINDVLEDLNEDAAFSLRDFINSLRSERISSSDCSRSLLSSITTLAERIHNVGLDFDKSVADVHHGRIFMMTSWSISYTIQTFERVTRFKGTPIFDDLESSKSLCLSSLISFACCSMMTHQSDMMQSLLIRKLRYLLINDEHLSSSPCCLDIDAFEMFVSLFILIQKLYAHIDELNPVPWVTKAFDHEYFRNVLHLMLILDMLQIIVSIQNETTRDFSATQKEQQSASNENNLHSFYKEVILASGHPNNVIPFSKEKLILELKKRLLPFLRSCAIFFYHLSRIVPPGILQNQSALFEGKDFLQSKNTQKSSTDFSSFDVNSKVIEEEFWALCQYLDLPDDLGKLLQSQEACHLARSWLRHSRVLLLIKSALSDKSSTKNETTSSEALILKRTGSSSCSIYQANPLSSSLSYLSCTSLSQISKSELVPVKFIRQPHLVNSLIELPYDYSNLVDKVSDFSCPSIKNEDSRTPTMCLVCGIMLCSQSYCCQRDLNDLASNYQQVLQLQQRSRQTSTNSPEVYSLSHSPNQANTNQYSPTTLVFNQNDAPTAMLSHYAGTQPMASSPSSSSSVTMHQQLVGSCTYHAHECSGGVGVFLRIRSCQVLLLSGRSKGCYMPAPYIDDHGETDFGLVRGNPLHLNRQHYEKLQLMWLTHAIPEQISRTLEYSPYASSINWHLH